MSSLKVIDDRCITCGACVSIDADHFDFDNETGISKVISDDNITDKTRDAVAACPVAAIVLDENATDNVVQFPSNNEEAEEKAA